MPDVNSPSAPPDPTSAETATERADDNSPPPPQLGVSLLASDKPGRRVALDPDRAYLENCATFNQAMNPNILTNIFKSTDKLFVHYNSGTTTTNTKGMLGSLECWLNENGIANLLIIPELTRLGYTITLDNRLDFTYQVTLTGEVHGGPATIQFKLDKKGLPYIDVEQGVVFTQVMVHTVRENMEGFTKQEREKATLACEAQGLLGHVSATELDFW